jgi:sulfatase maturation enzyme AslB (radical SAM superfamily)
MSCGPAEKLTKLAEDFETVEAQIDTMIADVESQVGAIQATAQAEVDKVIGSLKGLIPEIDIPLIPDSVQNDFTNIVRNILTAQLAAEDIANELTRLEQKWSGVDLGNIRIQDIPQLLRSGALDLDRICKLVPNFEKDGSQIVLKGTPISFPEINVADILKGGSLPNIQVPDFAEVVTRRVQKGTEKFINISVPGLYRG